MFSTNAMDLPLQNGLVGTLWDNVTALDSNADLAGVLRAIRSTAGRNTPTVGLSRLTSETETGDTSNSSASSFQLGQTLNKPGFRGDFSRGFLNSRSLFPQPAISGPLADDQPIQGEGDGGIRLRDPLTGLPVPTEVVLPNGNIFLNFSSAFAGTLEDKDGEGTGFTSLQTNRTDEQGDLFDASDINLNTTAGDLSLTAAPRSSASTNTLENALQLPITATQPFTIRARLKDLPTDLATTTQHGGIFLGAGQNNYVQLALVSNNDGLGLRFFQEQNGLGSNVGGDDALQILDPPPSSIQTLDLFLIGDPATGIIKAAYRINSDTATPTFLTQQFQPNSPEVFFADNSVAHTGILPSIVITPDTTNPSASSPLAVTESGETATYDNFGIQYAPEATAAEDIKIDFQPNTSTALAGYIADTGKAYQSYGGGQAFGWVRQDSLSNTVHVPLDITSNARARDRAGVSQQLNTLIHMQGGDVRNFSGVKIPAAWEYALPNGLYSVAVSVGDQRRYNSQNVINVEGRALIPSFRGNSIHEYELGTVQVNVNDGRLTVDAIGGKNTKINYLEIKSMLPGDHPSIAGGLPIRRETGVNRSTAVSLDVNLSSVGAGVDGATLTTDNIQLYRTRDNALIPGNINTTGGGDAIVYQPSSTLEASTHYTFRLSDGVKDQFGNPFLPFSSTFSTGTTVDIPPVPAVDFTKSTAYSGASISSLIMSPDNSKLYAASLDGNLRRWTVDPSSGNLTNLQTFTGLAGTDAAGPRAIIGIAFDPTNPNVLWVSNNDSIATQPANDFTGKISKLTLQSGSGFSATVQDYVVGLPRSAKDHLSNSLSFGPNGLLYMTQGSNSAMGERDAAWYARPERLLNAAVLQINPRLTLTQPINVQTENYTYTRVNPITSEPETITKTGNYDPYDPNAPVKIYATGVRNAYDLVWHTNGNLYTPTNGSAAGGNTPDNPNTAANEGLNNAATQNDYLFKVIRGGYYGHPNPLQNEYVMNGGNPTSAKDLAEVVALSSYKGYAVGTQPDPNYRGFAYDFGRNRSPNGAIEYQSNTFGGALKNKLLVVEYSGGDDILALDPDANGNIPVDGVVQAASGFKNPLDLIEDIRNGSLYVAELISETTGEGRITLLRPNGNNSGNPGATPNIVQDTNRLIFDDVKGGASSAAQTVTLSNTGDANLTISRLTLSGTDANQFQIKTPLRSPLTITPGSSAKINVVFNPKTTGPKGSLLQIQSNDPDAPQTTVTLRGLGKQGLSGPREPSLQWILDTYQIPINVGDPDPTNNAMPTTTPLGDEVDLPRFQKAGSGPVTVEPIAAFGAQDSSSGLVARFGYYTSEDGTNQRELFTIPNASYQSLNPSRSGSQSFDPGTANFGFYSIWPHFDNRAVYSEDNLNTFAGAIPHHVRVYPFKNPDGTVEPNAYVMTTEETIAGFDYQDLAVVIRNVQLAPGVGKLRVLTPDASIVPNRMVFGTVNEEVRAPKTLTLTNTGRGPLTVSLSIGNSQENIAKRSADNNRAADFRLLTPSSLTLARGESQEVSIEFAPRRTASNSKDSITDTLNAENYASLTISSDDPTQPTRTVSLAGLDFADYEGNFEPSSAEMARIFGWTLNVGSEKQIMGRTKLLGDEVYSPYWLRADSSRPVYLWPLAVTSGRDDIPHGTVKFEYKDGSEGDVIYRFAGRIDDDSPTGTEVLGSNDLSGGENQKLLPKIIIKGVNSVPTADTTNFIPTKAFALSSYGGSTDDTQNGTEQLHNWRMYPVRDAQGTLIPNTWYAINDIGNIDQPPKNFDYNDHVYLLVNAKPEFAATDFSSDGQTDIVWRNEATGENAVWQMNGTELVEATYLPSVANSNWQIGGENDFNGDGQPDILWRNEATGENAVWQMNGTELVEATYLPSVANSNWQIVGTDDFNGDGQPDIIWSNRATNQNAVWQMNGTSFSQATYLPSVANSNWQIVGTGDFNGDGQPDLLWRQQVTGQNAVWQMNGTELVEATYLPPVANTSWQVGGIGDFNGDGQPDILWRKEDTGENAVWQMNGTELGEATYLPSVANPDWQIAGPR